LYSTPLITCAQCDDVWPSKSKALRTEAGQVVN
jgi:hypothetical protein